MKFGEIIAKYVEDPQGKKCFIPFAGKGFELMHLRNMEFILHANDINNVRNIITRANVGEIYSDKNKEFIEALNSELRDFAYVGTDGGVLNDKFNTDNASRIIYCRDRIASLDPSERNFLEASLVSTVISYENAKVPFFIKPVHKSQSPFRTESTVHQRDSMDVSFLSECSSECDIAVIRPPSKAFTLSDTISGLFGGLDDDVGYPAFTRRSLETLLSSIACPIIFLISRNEFDIGLLKSLGGKLTMEKYKNSELIFCINRS
jgi:hypothetical protein